MIITNFNKKIFLPEIEKRPISRFDVEQPMFHEINGAYLTTETIGIYTADVLRKTEDMIFNEIQKLIHDEGLTSLYVLNRQQVFLALLEYVEKEDERWLK